MELQNIYSLMKHSRFYDLMILKSIFFIYYYYLFIQYDL